MKKQKYQRGKWMKIKIEVAWSKFDVCIDEWEY